VVENRLLIIPGLCAVILILFVDVNLLHDRIDLRYSFLF
jgi:hypothetical protein